MKISTHILLFLMLVSPFVRASTDSVTVQIEEVKKQLISSKKDTSTISLLNRITLLYKEQNADSAMLYGNKAIDLAKGLSDHKLLANSYNNLGIVYQDMGQFDESLDLFIKATNICDSIGDKQLLAKTYNNIGNDHRHLGNNALALEFYQKSLRLQEELNNELEVGKLYNNIGLIEVRNKNLDQAIDYYERSLEIVEKYGDKPSSSNALNSIGIAYYYKGEIEKTIFYFQRSLDIDKEMGDKLGQAISLNNIGELYYEIEDYQTAIDFLKRSTRLSLEVKAGDLLRHTYQVLAQNYNYANQGDSAYRYQVLYTALTDSLINVEKNKQIVEMQTKFSTAEHEKENERLKKEQALKDLKLAQRRSIQYLLIGGILIVVLIALALYLKYRTKQKANVQLQQQRDEIEEKNTEIIDSITYAQRIQQAILKSEEYESKHLPEHFILYQPKDIVSGDFYWAKDIHDHLYVAVADCTGHGVPGALMSMLGISLLNDIVSDQKNLSPSEILNELRQRIIDELSQSGNEEDSKDGMDISLIRINVTSREIQWAGANNPLWILRENEQEIEQIKPDKQPIAYYYEMKKFTNHSLQLSKNDSVYLFSDGYADQFGGGKGKKLKYKALRELILQNGKESMEMQKLLLKKYFENWKGDFEQIDDVCVLGLKL